jgi:hypothetical protein
VTPVLCVALFLSGMLGPSPLTQGAPVKVRLRLQDVQGPAPEKQPSSPHQQPPASPAKSPEKPKKVITNDDLKPASGGDGFSSMDFSQINDCDRGCFEQVRQLARVAPEFNPNWKRNLLQAVDTVRKDDQWQKHLRDLYDVHLKFCQLGAEKKNELAKHADPHNVTPQEIAIDEKYDAKFKQAQAELQSLYDRQGAMQRKFGENPLAYQFTIVQTNRIQNASCPLQQYPSYTPGDDNDP